MLPWCFDAEMSTANSLHALTLYGGEYNKRFKKTSKEKYTLNEKICLMFT